MQLIGKGTWRPGRTCHAAGVRLAGTRFRETVMSARWHAARLDEPRRPDSGTASRFRSHRANRHHDGGNGKSANGKSSAFSFIPKSPTRRTGRHCCADSFSISADAAAIGRSDRSSRTPSNAFASRSAMAARLCAISGGVDSTVAATLVSRAIGDRLIGVFVNTGLLRKNEFEKVLSMLQQQSAPERSRRRCIRSFSEHAGRRHRSGKEAEDHRQRIHPRLRRGSPEHRCRRFSRPGNACIRMSSNRFR